MKADAAPVPVMFLSVQSPAGVNVMAPAFAAVMLSPALVARLKLLSGLCAEHGIDSLETSSLDPPVYWDIGDASAAPEDHHWVWHVVGSTHFGELCGYRRRADGSLGGYHVIGHTAAVDLEDIRRQIQDCRAVTFHEHEDWHEQHGQGFAAYVTSVMTSRGLWPHFEVPP